MASGIYAIANIGHKKLYVSDASSLQSKWPQLLTMLNQGIYPNAALQEAWNREGGQRHFSFHTKQELIGNQEIVGIEHLIEDIQSAG